MPKTLLELMASKYAYDTLSFIHANPNTSKTDIIRSFPYEEERTRFTRLQELERYGLIASTDREGKRTKHKVDAMIITEKGLKTFEMCSELSSTYCTDCDPRINEGLSWLVGYQKRELDSEDLQPVPADFYEHVDNIRTVIDDTLTGDSRRLKRDRLDILVKSIREARIRKICALSTYNGLHTNTVDIPFVSDLKKECELYERIRTMIEEYNNLQ